MMNLSNDDLARLREKCQGVPSPWTFEPHGIGGIITIKTDYPNREIANIQTVSYAAGSTRRIGEFIAAMDPQTTLALLGELERALKAARSLYDAARYYLKSNDQHCEWIFRAAIEQADRLRGDGVDGTAPITLEESIEISNKASASGPAYKKWCDDLDKDRKELAAYRASEGQEHTDADR